MSSKERLERLRRRREAADYSEGMVSRCMGLDKLADKASQVDAQFRRIASDAVKHQAEAAVLRAVQRPQFGDVIGNAVTQALGPLVEGSHPFSPEAMKAKMAVQGQHASVVGPGLLVAGPVGGAVQGRPEAAAAPVGASHLAVEPTGPVGLGQEEPQQDSWLKKRKGPHGPGDPGYNAPLPMSKRTRRKRTLANFPVTASGSAFPYVTEPMRRQLEAAGLSTCQQLFVKWVLQNRYHRWQESGREARDWELSFLPTAPMLIQEAELAFPDMELAEFSWEKALERCRKQEWLPTEARMRHGLRGGSSADQEGDPNEGSGESGGPQGRADSQGGPAGGSCEGTNRGAPGERSQGVQGDVIDLD